MAPFAVSDARELCRGCLRTIDEIVGWGSADIAARGAVWTRIERRRKELAAASGGGV